MYLIQCIRFASWKELRLNRALLYFSSIYNTKPAEKSDTRQAYTQAYLREFWENFGGILLALAKFRRTPIWRVVKG